ncbi:alkylation response protein AidB-like acyl-CoA dehydrogenase [Sphingomonas jinjuensis]|uniref:Alkylation response protein AidB-like acyl-CoA dehydrogenase n=1 Tax=Sphingomonas jinjuensis TaxID=535907 RepID=A0A840F927_9SPHN|nr:hypothetical protein [Sphingomonas jinjuensis]MBB4154199.1 alkylation response protein AidB-like acyl-CoA dehydrogenase [Sphingomonas jinjuensis]
MDLEKILKLIGTAQAAFAAAVDIAAEAGAVLSEADQGKLRQRLASLAAENDASHAALQARLA